MRAGCGVQADGPRSACFPKPLPQSQLTQRLTRPPSSAVTAGTKAHQVSPVGLVHLPLQRLAPAGLNEEVPQARQPARLLRPDHHLGNE